MEQCDFPTMLSVAAHIRQAYVRRSKPGFIRLKTREDHRSLTVRAKRALAGSFVMKNEGTERLSMTLPLDERERKTLSSPIAAGMEQ